MADRKISDLADGTAPQDADQLVAARGTSNVKLLWSELKTALNSLYALATRQILAGTGLTGGGDLSADRTLTVSYGTTAGTAAQGNDARLSDSRTPSGSAGGDLTGTYPNPTLGTSGVTAATYGDSTNVAQVAFDAKGRATAASNVAISFPSPTFIGARIYNGVAQTITTATNTNSQYDTTDYSNGVTVDLANDKITIITAGYYLVQCSSSFASNATGIRQSIAILNGTYNGGTGTTVANSILNAANGASTNILASAVVHLAVNDFITGGCRQTSGGNLNTNTGPGNEYLAAALIGI